MVFIDILLYERCYESELYAKGLILQRPSRRRWRAWPARASRKALVLDIPQLHRDRNKAEKVPEQLVIGPFQSDVTSRLLTTCHCVHRSPKRCSCLITALLFANHSMASSFAVILPLPSGGERQRTWKNQFQARGLMGSPTVPSTAREERSLPSTNLSSCASSARISVGAV